MNPTHISHRKIDRKNNYYFLISIASIIFLSIHHLWIGSSIEIVIILSIISVIGFKFIHKCKIYFSNIFIFITSLYSGYLQLIIKGILLQPLQSNLYGGIDTHIYLLMGFISLAAAGALIPHTGAENTFIRHFNSEDFLKRYTLPFLALGLALHILHVILRPALDQGQVEKTEGFGGFGSFYFLLIIAISFQLKLYAKNPKNKKYTTYIIITSLVMFFLSIAANVKKDIFDFLFLCAFATYAFNIRVKWNYILIGVLFIAILTLYVSPTIHIMRDGVTSLGIAERVSLFFEILSANDYSYEKLARAEAHYISGFSLNYSPHGSYVFPSMLNIDRFMFAHPIDLVVRQMEYVKLMGIGEFFQSVLNGVLPSFLIQKTNAAGADLVAWHYGFRQAESLARPVVGFTASAAAAWGFWGVVTLPFLVLFPLLTLADYLFGRLKNNAWCLAAVGLSSQLAEKEIDAILIFFLRQVPIVLIFSLACIYLYRARYGGRALAARHWR